MNKSGNTINGQVFLVERNPRTPNALNPQNIKNNGFKIILSRQTMEVEQIFYPRLDPLADDGKMEDLFPKGSVILFSESKRAT